MAQQAVHDNQVIMAPVTAVASPLTGALTSTFATSGTTIHHNAYDAQAAGNQSDSALDISNQPLTSPTVIVTQTAGAAVTGITDVAIGIDTTATSSGNTGSRTNAQGVVSGNAAISSASGNAAAATLSARSDAALAAGSSTGVRTEQTTTGAIQALTDASLVGIDVLPRSVNIFNPANWDNVSLTASDNRVEATASANQSEAGIGLSAASALTIGAPVSSTATQTQAGTVEASSQAGLVGIGIGNTLATSLILPANGDFTVAGNGVAASARGNQLDNMVQIDAATAVQSGGSLNNVAASSQQSGSAGVSARGHVDNLGALNQKPVSSNNQYTVSGNRVDTDAQGNIASSAAVVGTSANRVSAITGLGASVSNDQSHVSADGISAQSSANFIGVAIGGAVGVSNNDQQVVSGNALTASAGSAQADNQSVLHGVLIDQSSASVSNSQTHAGRIQATALVSTLGTSAVTSASNGQQTIHGNAVVAGVLGAEADNLAAVHGSTISGSRASVDNNQTHVSGTVNATASVGLLGAASALGVDNQTTVNDNLVRTNAQGALASNQASVRGDSTVANAGAEALNTQRHESGDTTALTFVSNVGTIKPLSTNEQLVVNGNTLAASANSQSASNQASLNGSSMTATSASAGTTVNNMQTHAGGMVQAYVGDSLGFSPGPFTPAPALVGAEGSAVGGTVQVSGNSASAEADINLATNVASIQSDASAASPGAGSLQNNQSVTNGNAQAHVSVNYGITGVRSIGNQAVVSNNTSAASASQNQAANTLSIETGDALSGVSPTLVSTQISGGNTTAIVETALLTGTGVANSNNGATSISGNAASTSARANVVNNAMIIEAGTLLTAPLSHLGNLQSNGGATTATTDLQVPVGSLLANQALGGAVTVSGNTAEALAMGNAALNALQADAGTALNGGTQFALLNTQINSGAVAASTTLNVPVVSSGSSTQLLGNSASASAFGNSAVNQMAMAALPGQVLASANLTSLQINTAAVTAQVNGNFTNTSGGGTSGSIGISGNRANAVAVGNSANSSMTLSVR